MSGGSKIYKRIDVGISDSGIYFNKPSTHTHRELSYTPKAIEINTD